MPNGKGSAQRPTNRERFSQSYDRIFARQPAQPPAGATISAGTTQDTPAEAAAADGQFGARQIGDPADGKGTGPVISRRAAGWTVEEWIAAIDRNPHRTLPGGVGALIVDYFREETRR